MKRITAAALFALVSLVTVGSSLAQENAVQATIPFDFTVNSKLLPPGTYRIKAVSSNVVSIVSVGGNIAVMSLSYSDDTRPGDVGKLVFNRYGNQYFLNKITSPALAKCIDLPVSKRERSARWEQGLLNNNQQTFVALK